MSAIFMELAINIAQILRVCAHTGLILHDAKFGISLAFTSIYPISPSTFSKTNLVQLRNTRDQMDNFSLIMYKILSSSRF